MAKSKAYVAQGIPTNIKATSRCAIKIKDNYYTIEVTEERSLPSNIEAIEMDKEYEALFNSVNDVVDGQMNEILETFGK